MTKTLVRALSTGLLLCSPALHAEVSVDAVAGGVNTLILGVITDDPSPIGVWLPYRPLPPNRLLNAAGDARGDGMPDLAWRDNSWPVAVWTYNAGGDFDIAFSEWDGTQWSTTAFLTASTDDERDPRVWIEPDGTIHVVWWTAGANDEVYLATLHAGSSIWNPPVAVTMGAESGRRPAVAVFNGQLIVAYEHDSASPGMAQDVQVAAQPSGGAFTFETIGATARTETLDVMLHSAQGHLWVDWKHDVDEFGCAERLPGGEWTPMMHEPWTDPSWVGVEGTRKAIREHVLAD